MRALGGALSLFGVVALLPSAANADVIIAPIAFFAGLTAMAAIQTMGAALAFVSIVEAVILARRENLDFKRSLVLSAKANTYSTLFGLLVGILASSSSLFIIGMPLALFALSDKSQETIGVNLGNAIVRILVAVPITFAVLHLACLTIPGIPVRPLHDFPTPGDARIAALAAVSLVVFGFLLSVLSEGRTVGRQLGRPVLMTVFLMNLVSYPLLLLVTIPLIKKAVQERTWYWHEPNFKQSDE
jgi:hypothetical protein